jgi:hypothetical protein
MRNLGLIFAMLAGLVVLGGCVQFRPDNPPLVVNVKSDGDNCRVTVQREHFAQPAVFVRVNQGQLLEIGRQTKPRRAIVIFDVNAHYKCIGAAIVTLQEAGLAVESAMWDSR